MARGFDSLDLARSAVLTPAQQAMLGDEVASWTRRLAALQSAAEAPDLAGLDPANADEMRSRASRAAVGLARAREIEQQARTTPWWPGPSGSAAGWPRYGWLRPRPPPLWQLPGRSSTWPGWPRAWTGIAGWR
jgi:hypothetical protein